MATARVTLNAWTGEGTGGAAGELAASARRWGLREAGRPVRKDLKPPAEADPRNWRDPGVGWGLILPATQGLSQEALASGSDAPEPIRDLVAARAAAQGKVPIFRYEPTLPQDQPLRFLRNYAARKDLSTAGSAVGLADHQIPKYLLICGSPAQVPWQLQYVLSAQRAVGRLDLDETGLGNYVQALLTDWAGAGSDVHRAVVWAVVHGPEDITSTLRGLIARPLHQRLAGDGDIGAAGARFLDGQTGDASAQALISALVADRPAVVVTTSHGMTGPLNDATKMKADLGLLVDQGFKTLDPDKLLDQWSPDGAVWLAHACCSAGAAAESAYQELFQAGSDIERVLSAVAALGDLVAPLPRRLLGHAKPLRAFIGQVEPTFDWTIRDPANGQRLSDALCGAIYPELFREKPVGLALEGWQQLVDTYYRIWDNMRKRFDEGEDLGEELIMPRLAARDVQSTVILGDPTAVLPAL